MSRCPSFAGPVWRLSGGDHAEKACSAHDDGSRPAARRNRQARDRGPGQAAPSGATSGEKPALPQPVMTTGSPSSVFALRSL